MRSTVLVEQAWKAALPDVPYDPTQSWADAGGDSLKVLTLVLHLEQVGELQIPYDRLSMEMTPDDLVALVDELRAQRTPSPPLPASQPTLYMAPGVLGDTLKIARFASGLQGRLNVEVVRAPGLESPPSTILSVRGSAAKIAESIAARQPSGPLHLAGYCFGGVLAFEAARQLTRAGRHVASLAIIDGSIASPTRDGPLPMQSGRAGKVDVAHLTNEELRPWWSHGAAPGWKHRLLNVAFRRRWYGLLAAVAKVAIRRSGGGHWLAEALLHRLRAMAWASYDPSAGPETIRVFATGEMRTLAGDDLGWRSWCSILSVAPLSGGHMQVFDPEQTPELGPLLVDHVLAGESSPSSTPTRLAALSA